MNGRQFLKRISSPILKLVSTYYLGKKRNFKFKNIDLIVLPKVFHPGLFISTKLLLNLADSLDLNNKTVLELGAGSGAISVFCAKQGANVTATDINPTAIENVKLNANRNEVTIHTIASDLFTEIPENTFDYVFINPPYYPKKPTNDEEFAWYCGEEFEYFKNLFAQLNAYIDSGSTVFIILSEDCELTKIKCIAHIKQFELVLYKKVKKWMEWNYIFTANPFN